MKNGSISFKPAMIQAIQAGRKTQTRRLVNGEFKSYEEGWSLNGEAPRTLREDFAPHKVGDVLWVKEALQPNEGGFVSYVSDDAPVMPSVYWDWKPAKLASMYCPRWASRYSIRITEVRCQRLQEISEADAVAEGIYKADTPSPWSGVQYRATAPTQFVEHESTWFHKAAMAYSALWESINGKGSWAENPWVFAYTFEILKTPSK